MASFKLKFRPSVTQGQEGTLYFQVIHRRVVKMIYTDSIYDRTNGMIPPPLSESPARRKGRLSCN